MKISKVVVRRMSLDFKVPFRTSFGLNTTKDWGCGYFFGPFW